METTTNVFENSSLVTIYQLKWIEESRRKFNDSEKSIIKNVEVVASQYGTSLKLFLTNGGVTFFKLDERATIGIGEHPNLDDLWLVTLKRNTDIKLRVLN